MPEHYILKYIDENGNPSVCISHDIGLVNKTAKEAKRVITLTLERDDLVASINYDTGEIIVNGETYFKPEFRWINFRRQRMILPLGGEGTVTKEHDNFMGWQITLGGKNFKKIIKIAPDGEVSEWQA